jgi:hypothetical protein
MIDLVDNLHTGNDKFSFMKKTTHDSFVRPELGKNLGQKSSGITHERLSLADLLSETENHHSKFTSHK